MKTTDNAVCKPAVKERDPWLDNAKGILILLVVTGHMMSGLCSHADWLMTMYKTITGSHMLLFTFITGYLAKRRIENKEYDKIIARFFVPYLILQFIYYIVLCIQNIFTKTMSDGQSLSRLVWGRPIYLLWFLMTVFLCAMIATVLPCKKHPVLVLVGAFLISWAAIFLPEITYLRLSKTLGYLPVFLLGYIFDKEKLMFLRNNKALRIVAAAIVAGWLAFFILGTQYVYRNVLNLATCYWNFKAAYRGMYGIFARPVFLICGMFFSLSFLVLIPRCKTAFTNLGQKSLYVFALHGIVVLLWRTFNAKVYSVNSRINSPIEYIAFFLLVAAMTFFLGSNFISKIFKPVFEPNIDLSRFFKKKDAAV